MFLPIYCFKAHISNMKANQQERFRRPGQEGVPQCIAHFLAVAFLLNILNLVNFILNCSKVLVLNMFKF